MRYDELQENSQSNIFHSYSECEIFFFLISIQLYARLSKHQLHLLLLSL